MLLSSALQEFAVTIHFGSKQEVEQQLLLQAIRSINSNEYQDTRIVIKGCGDRTVSEAAWVEITNKLQPFAKSLMYGEALAARCQFTNAQSNFHLLP